MMKRFYFFAGLIVLLSGCTYNKTMPSSEPTNVQKSVVQTQDLRCVNDFFVLKTIADAPYKNYRTQFDLLSNSYQLYQLTVPKLDKDQKELFSMALDSKLVVLCARVKYSSFTNVNGIVKKIEAL
ncbi:hypothetical protein ACMV5I_28620 [Serratia sp. T13T92]|uniref:hypothetical protein n=1 Tax=Serratia sp. T13T92 TaxID=3397496 RepID=UPI0039E0A062